MCTVSAIKYIRPAFIIYYLPFRTRLESNETISDLLKMATFPSSQDNNENIVINIEVPKQQVYICHLCANQYKHENSLKRHLAQHSDSSKRFQCVDCGKEFRARRYLKQHVKGKHTETPKLLCHDCGLNFKSHNALSNHLRFKHQHKCKVCSLCGYACKDKYSLTRHMKKHDQRKSVCPKCSQTFKNVSSHLLKCTNERVRRFSCDQCMVFFTEKKYLVKHLKNKHFQTNRFVCNCGKAFSYAYSLNRHKKTCIDAIFL